MAGEIIIRTGLDTKGFEKQLQALKDKLEKQEIDLNIINIDYESAKRQLENIEKDLQKNQKHEEEIKNKLSEQLAIREQLAKQGKDTNIVNETISYLYNELGQTTDESIKLTNSWLKQSDVLDKIEIKQQKQKSDIEQTKQKMVDLNIEAEEYRKKMAMSRTLKNISKRIDEIGKTMLKTGLLMMGIQSTMTMFRQSFDRVKEGHPELEQAMDHIKGIIDVLVDKFVTMIEPLLPKLIPLIKRIVTMILKISDICMTILVPVIEWFIDTIEWLANAIADVVYYLSFGLVDIRVTDKEVENLSTNADNFANNMKQSAKEAGKLRKQLFGFDEMEVLNDSGTTGAINNMKRAVDEAEKVKDVVEKTSEYYSHTGSSGFGHTSGGRHDKVEWYALELGANLGVVGAQAVEAVESLKKSPLIEKLFGTNKENKTESKDLIKLVKATIDDNIEERNKAIEELKKQSWFQAMFGGDNVEYVEQAVNGIKGANDEIFEAVRKGSYKVKNGYYEIKLASGQVVKYSKDEFNQLKSVVEQMGEAGKTSADKTKKSWNETGTSVEETANNITENASENASQTTSLWQRAYNLITQSNQTEGEKQKQNSSKNTKETINDTKTQVDNYNKNPSTAKVQVKQDDKNNSKTTTKEIQNDVDKTKPTVKLDVEKNSLQKIHDKIKEALKFTLTYQGATGAIGGAGSIKASAKGSIINYPKLASGGIINRPGRGVMLANGGTIAGERGREAVIPLTDSGQMELLGQAIARNIIINLNNEVRLDGKQLARYTSKVMSDMQFSSNGGVI